MVNNTLLTNHSVKEFHIKAFWLIHMKNFLPCTFYLMFYLFIYAVKKNLHIILCIANFTDST